MAEDQVPTRGRPAAPTCIVQIPLARTFLKELKITHRELSNVTSNDLECIKWLAKHNLISNAILCDDCHINMSFQRRTGKEYIDGYAWACRQCKKHRSIRVGSFFCRSHLKLIQLLDIIYWWSTDMELYHVVQETGVSRRIIIDWQENIKDICSQYLIDHPIKLGENQFGNILYGISLYSKF